MFQAIWIVVAGLIIGLIAKGIVPGKQRIPLWLTVALGIVGALVAVVAPMWASRGRRSTRAM